MIPNFDPPRYEELRAWWVRFPMREVRRLILEVQERRYTLAEMRGLAHDALQQMEKGTPSYRAVQKLLRRLDSEVKRAGKIYEIPQMSEREKERISRAPPVKF